MPVDQKAKPLDSLTVATADVGLQSGTLRTRAQDSDVIVDQLRHFCTLHRVSRLTVVFSVAIAEPLASKLLALPKMVGVIFAGEPRDLTGIDADRVGWLRPDGRVGRFPSRLGSMLVAFGDPEAFGFQLARLSLARGGRRIAFDTPLGFTEPRSLWLVLAGTARWGAKRVFYRRLRDMGLSGQLQKLGLIEHLLRRRLRLLLRSLPSTPRSGTHVPGRVVFVTGSLGPGGAERQLVNTVLGVAKNGKRDLHLLSERLSPAPNDFYLPKLEACDGLSIVELGALRRHTDTGIAAEISRLIKVLTPAFRIELMRLILMFEHLRPEIVHAWQDGPSAKAGLAAAITGVDRIVLSWRSLAPVETGLYDPCYAPIFQALAKRDNVVFLNNSAAGAKSYARWLGFEATRIKVIHNSVDFASLEPPTAPDLAAYRKKTGLPAKAPVVGTIFRFGPEKRPMLWLEIAARVAERRPDVHFLMLGAGPLLDEARAAVRRMGLEDRVHLPGRSTTPALALAAMDVFLLTSILEGLPNVVIEAGAMGVPVVSTDVGGVREALEHGETGFAVASDDPARLADKVIEMLADEDWRAAVAARAPGRVRKRFHADRMIRETLEAFGSAGRPAAGTADVAVTEDGRYARKAS